MWPCFTLVPVGSAGLIHLRTIGTGTSGSANGQFNTPVGLAVDASSNLYVADFGNRRIQVFNSSGGFLRHFGVQGTGPGQFRNPITVAVSPAQTLYVGETLNSRVQVVDLQGNFISNFAVKGSQPENIPGEPREIAFAGGVVHICQVGSAPATGVKRYTAAGDYIDLLATPTETYPEGVAIDSQGQIFVASSNRGKIEVFSPTGQPLRTLGSRGTAPGQMLNPRAIEFDADNSLYVVDDLGGRLQVLDRDGNSMLIIGEQNQPGPANDRFNRPSGLAIDGDTVYVADTGNQRVQVYQITRDQITLAAFAASFNLAGADAEALSDSDVDGQPLLLEYALGTNPTQADSAAPQPLLSADGQFQIAVTRPSTTTGLQYAVEASGNLQAWSTAGTVVIEDSPTRLRVAAGSPNLRYLRLRVTLQP